MNVVVTITHAELRGVPFERYSETLRYLVGESNIYEDIGIIQGYRAGVSIDGNPQAPEAAALLQMAKDITKPAFYHRLFLLGRK